MPLLILSPPFLALTLFEIIGIVVFGMVIAGALVSIALDVRKYTRDSGSGASAAGLAALSEMDALRKAILKRGTSATAAECQRLRDLLLQAKSGGISDMTIDALKAQIDGLCPG